jgi:hypothetical protein
LSTGSVPQSDGKKLYIIITSSLNRSFKSLWYNCTIFLRSSTVNFKLSEIKLQCTYERSMLSRIVGWYIRDLDVISNFILTFLLKTCFTKLPWWHYQICNSQEKTVIRNRWYVWKIFIEWS